MKKRMLAFTLILVALLQTVGCGAGEGAQTESTTETSTETSTELTTEEVAPAEIVLSAEDVIYTIIRSENAEDGVIDLATELRNQLADMIGKSSGVKISDDWAKNEEMAEKNPREIVVGLTNRKASASAAQALPGYRDFSVSIIDERICIYANSVERLTQAVSYFLANVTKEEGKLIYRGGNYIDAYTYPMASMHIGGVPVGQFTIVIPAKASDTEYAVAEGIQTYIAEQSGHLLPLVEDTAPAAEAEIIIGFADRPEIANLKKEGYSIMSDKKKLMVVAGSAAYYYAAKSELIEQIEEGGGSVTQGIKIEATDSALDFFLKDCYIAGKIREEMTLGAMAVLSSCEYFNDRMIYGSENLGERWVYSNRGANAKQTGYFDDMLTSSKKGGNCASPINWALCEMGIVPTNDRFYGGSSGEFKSYSGDAEEYLAPYCDYFDYSDDPVTFKELYKSGKVEVGDIFLCKHHTFVYRGDESFYAAGHDGAWHTEADAPTEDERKAVFDNWVLAFDEVAQSGKKSSTSYNTNYNYKVYYVVRLKDDYIPAFYRNGEGKLVENPMAEK